MFPIVGGMAETKTRDLEAIRRGAAINELRQAYGVSTAKLAASLDPKITRRYLSYIEAGEKLAPVVLCRKIADYLGVSLAAITVEGYVPDDSAKDLAS